jgi:predicted short-subunit dehydrogenase-like oxidoreductase (DUF2520 family)
MTPAPRGDALWIVGTGRLGLALGLALHRAGAVRALAFSGRVPSPPAHPLFDGPSPAAAYFADEAIPPDFDAVVVAVPDDALAEMAARWRSAGCRRRFPSSTPAAAGARRCLRRWRRRGTRWAPCIRWRRSRTPCAGRTGSAARTGGWRGTRRRPGRPSASSARWTATCWHVAPGGKALYHAAAVFASNYAVALLSVAEGVMVRGGADPANARAALAMLAGGAVRNVAEHGPSAALTGPIARGDAETVALHLSRLSADERAVYSVLGREALRLARAGGLDAAAADRLGRLLGEGE